MNGERFVGLDLGKRTYVACAIDDAGGEVRWNGKTDEEGRERLAARLRAGDIVAMETGSTTFAIARRIAQLEGVQVVVLNPAKLAVIYASMKKTDKEDALKLARLVQTMPLDYLPAVSVPTLEEEAMRRLSAGQVFLNHERTRLINRLHGVFLGYGMTEIGTKTLAHEKSRERTVQQLEGVYRQLAEQIVALLREVELQIGKMKETIRNTVSERYEQTQLLMSIPGVGPVTVMAFLGYIGDGSRFATAAQVSYYAGLVPRIDNSGQQVHSGHITKAGSPTIRRAVVQAAWAAIRAKTGGHFKEVYERIEAARGSSIAIVAVGRRILELMYTVLKTGEFYRYSPLAERLRKLRYYKMAVKGAGST
jgi:transposase